MAAGLYSMRLGDLRIETFWKPSLTKNSARGVENGLAGRPPRDPPASL
jgi:hypothetical protein